jgi:hypothetical protein
VEPFNLRRSLAKRQIQIPHCGKNCQANLRLLPWYEYGVEKITGRVYVLMHSDESLAALSQYLVVDAFDQKLSTSAMYLQNISPIKIADCKLITRQTPFELSAKIT